VLATTIAHIQTIVRYRYVNLAANLALKVVEKKVITTEAARSQEQIRIWG
jgi:hypothetical protein